MICWDSVSQVFAIIFFLQNKKSTDRQVSSANGDFADFDEFKSASGFQSKDNEEGMNMIPDVII